ncbi:hypothetical protein BCR34DRAFT_625041 [Clohesyomyces aquaticus]|uniref:cutinase n=1 Tax=Clohesyomyces aquaticus TaxID=1231657 RepID=A0A1Y1ZL83_9PLEO|nr:hypothetical protein BCR34DRAFT_625041 [Clohesyomyces aquaticus]
MPIVLAKFPSSSPNQLLRIIRALPLGAVAPNALEKILTPLQQDLAKAVNIDTTRSDVGLITGPPFIDALAKQLGEKSLSVQGVDNPAIFAGFSRNGSNSVPSMTKFIEQAISSYCQGALVVRGTAASLPTETMAKINSVLTFSDPGNQLTVCHENDAVCSDEFITVDHLMHGEDANTAANFVIQKSQGGAGP